MGLILFDLDGTLISSYMDNPDKDYHRWNLLPGRREKIETLLNVLDWVQRRIGVVTNQGGVAFGLVTEDDFIQKIGKVASALGMNGATIYQGGDGAPRQMIGWGQLQVWVCYADSRSKDPRYQVGAERRKPSGAMIREAIRQFNHQALDSMLVGDRPEDEAAARDAKAMFMWADEFFAE